MKRQLLKIGFALYIGAIIVLAGCAVQGSTKADDSQTKTSQEKPVTTTEHRTLDYMPQPAERVKLGMRSRQYEESAVYDTSGLYVAPPAPDLDTPSYDYYHNTEEYLRINDNPFLETVKNPLSTFSIDVDTASYANMRRFLNMGQLPYKDAVRIEELINYFTYDYPDPDGEHPFSFTSELSSAPWNPENRLLHIGIQGQRVDVKDLPPNNLVFLIDVSGSMYPPNRLPLAVSSLKMLVENLRPIDKISIVVYAGAAGLVLPPTSGKDKNIILDALDRLSAGGSTAGGAGIRLAYQVAEENYDPEANNRVILVTDGDFNVGVSSTSELERLIEEKRQTGVYLTILGFGMGNYKDNRMKTLSEKGNGNYAYIDNFLEAKKVLVTEMGGTLLSIAKDVKIQIEFNPAKVESYRLIGYERRVMRAEDFDNDKKDAGELGAGHSVTALYEIVPAKNGSAKNELKYQTTEINDTAFASDEIMTIKFRYKPPTSDISKLVTVPVRDNPLPLNATSDNFRFSASVASFGMILRDSEHKGNFNFDKVADLAKTSLGEDEYGYRREFVRLVQTAKGLSR